MISTTGFRRATAGFGVALLMAGSAHAAAPVTWSTPISGKSPFLAGCGIDIDATTPSLGQGFDDAESEPTIAANPADSKNLVAAWMQDYTQGYVAAWSRDGGRTWTTSSVPGNSICSGGDMELAADPWLSFGGDGTAYLAGFSLDLPDRTIAVPVRTRLQINVSRDGGRSWSAPSVVAAGAALLHDKPAITADPRTPCTAHIVWMEAATAFGGYVGAVTSRTSDCGRSWSAPLPVPVRTGADSWAPEILVLPDGDLLMMATTIPYGDNLASNGVEDPTGEPYTVAVVRSEDGGRSWSAPVTAAELAPAGSGLNPAEPFTDPETGESVKTAPLIASADAGVDGSVYIAFRRPSGERRSQILVTRSNDGGRTWSPPAIASTGVAETFLPSVAVAGNGTVGVTYYDFRHDVTGDAPFSADVWFSHSRDGGRTWTERHLDGPVDFRGAPLRQLPSTGRFVGDYHGLAGLRDGFGAAYGVTQPRASAGATDILFSRIGTEQGGRDPRERVSHPRPTPLPTSRPTKTTAARVPGGTLRFQTPRDCVARGRAFGVRLTWRRVRLRGNLSIKMRRADFFIGARRVKTDRRAPFTQTLRVSAGSTRGDRVAVRVRAFGEVHARRSLTRSIRSTVRVCR